MELVEFVLLRLFRDCQSVSLTNLRSLDIFTVIEKSEAFNFKHADKN